MNLFIYISFTMLAIVSTTRQFRYNTRYCISKPHYLQVTTMQPIVNSPSIPDIPVYNDYEIPNWVWRKVFKHNRRNKYNN